MNSLGRLASRLRRRVGPLVFGTALLAWLSCDSGTAPLPPARQASVIVTPATVELHELGATVQLLAEVRDQRGWVIAGASVTWSSADDSVAAVGGGGLVTATGNGQADITATSGSASGSATVTVAQAAGAVAVDPASVDLTVGDTARLMASARDANGHAVAGAAFAWTSGDESVAAVDDAGLVTGVSVGEVAVTASSGSASGSATVRVSPPPVPPEPAGAVPEQTLDAGRTATLDASVYFSDPDGGELTYAASSSDTAVATTEVAGSEVTVTGTGPGRATVTLTATDPDGLSATQGFVVVVSGSVDDDFESPASLNNWGAANADIAVARGALTMTNRTDGLLGLVKRRDMPALSEWTIQARMGRTTRGAGPGVVSATRHDRFTAVRLVLRTPDDADGDRNRRRNLIADEDAPAADSRNYEFAVFDAGAGDWVLLTNLSGRSESVFEEPGEFTEIAFGHQSGDFVGYVGETGDAEELFRVDLADARVDGVPLGEIVSDATGLWLANQGPSGSMALHDWVRATGTGSDATAPDEAEIEATPGEAARSETVVVPVISVTVLPSVDTLSVGDTLRLSAEAYDRNGRVVAGAAFSWSSSDESVATVDATGLVTAAAVGAATITAASSGVRGSSEIAVRPTVASVTVSPAAGLLAVGDTLRLSAVAYDRSGRVVTEAAFSWSSSDESVATVDVSGLVGAVAEGAATITASAEGASGSSEVAVRRAGSPSVVVSPKVGVLAVGDTLRLSAVAYDANGRAVPGAEFAWSSSDETVATVDASGLVAAAAEGAATITAIADGVSGSSTITVRRAGRDADRAILVALYEATDGPNWKNSENWLTDAPLGEWYGVATNALGRVTSVYVADNLLAGEIPPALGSLGSLRSLRAEENLLTGGIPPELGNLANLEHLSLGDNLLTGGIPSELASLGRLRWLELYDNQLTGGIPPELGNLANLEHLNLGDNLLTGGIPSELGRLGRLRSLYLHDGQLTGGVPPELGNLANLERLYLSENDLTGGVPAELASLANLEHLGLSHNGLEGQLPDGFLNLSLRRLWWHRNKGLCVPDTAAFRRWLSTMDYHSAGPYCSAARVRPPPTSRTTPLLSGRAAGDGLARRVKACSE